MVLARAVDVIINKWTITAVATSYDEFGFVEVKYLKNNAVFFISQIRFFSKKVGRAFTRKFNQPIAKEIFFNHQEIN